MEPDEGEVTVVSAKGQVVIPQPIRERLGLRPKSKLLVYAYHDAVILKKLRMPNLRRALERLFNQVDQRTAEYGQITDEEIMAIVQRYRHPKRTGP